MLQNYFEKDFFKIKFPQFLLFLEVVVNKSPEKGPQNGILDCSTKIGHLGSSHYEAENTVSLLQPVQQIATIKFEVNFFKRDLLAKFLVEQSNRPHICNLL